MFLRFYCKGLLKKNKFNVINIENNYYHEYRKNKMRTQGEKIFINYMYVHI